MIVDLTDPRAPTTVSYLHIPAGSHHMTIHPAESEPAFVRLPKEEQDARTAEALVAHT